MSSGVVRSRSLPSGPAALFAAFVAIGVAAFLWGLSTDPERAHRVFLHNWLLWAALAQGALVISAAMRLTNARWQGPVHRVVDSMGSFVPVSFVLFFVIYLGRHHIFDWIEHPVHYKEWWYNEGFFFGRDFFVLVWMTALSLFYLVLSVRPLLGPAREQASGWQAGLIRSWTSGWRGEAAEQELATRRLRKLSAVLALSFAIGYSLLGMDMVMSLAPHWVSTMFPAYFSWGGFLSACSMTAIICLVLRNSDGMKGQITTSRLHDMGKMIFAFSIFWMYLFWSQYLVIWYGNIPEETGFMVARLGSQFVQDTWYMASGVYQQGPGDSLGFWARIGEPYVQITLLTWFLCWVIPFWVLLGQKPKKTPAILGPVAVGSVFGFWTERYILVTPSLVTPEEVAAGSASITWLGPIEIGVALGFLGLFFLTFLTFGRVFPGILPASSDS